MCRVRYGIVAGCLMFLVGPVSAEMFVLDNKDNTTVITAGSQASIASQTFMINVPGAGTPANGGNDNIASMPPGIPMLLNTATFVKAPSGTATAGALFLDLYTSTGTGIDPLGTFLGSSTNSIDVNGATALANLTWNFDSLQLTQGVEYILRFSTDSGSGGTAGVEGRIAAANFGGGFVSTYAGGVARNAAGPAGGLAFDTRFELNVTAVPEPSSTILLLVGGAAIGGWRLRRKRLATA